ncbi:NADPH:quinone reductase-like Zn-dependent oxidoreductase [Nonomuraea soli]|uniref:NADPH:quinone reductase-like Zn-dependent oxidoreductase n=1 Tax=Nonomuraea soli TaxID=1032476 RepID=A0A7W0CS25_9ACTN|nr:NADPH:quinone reductase-like Zn-dependent oxidoreductase [Nonomuraea soli]
MVASLDEVTEPVDGVIDVVGGAVLGRAFALLADGGRAIAVGTMGGDPLVLDPAGLVTPARRTLETFWGQWPSGPALGEVLTLIDRGLLRPENPPAQRWTAVHRPAARSVVTVTR